MKHPDQRILHQFDPECKWESAADKACLVPGSAPAENPPGPLDYKHRAINIEL